MEDKSAEIKEELTEEELRLLSQVLINAPTQNLQTAERLILLNNKIARILDNMGAKPSNVSDKA